MTSDTPLQIWTRKLEELSTASTVPTENLSINLLLYSLVLETLQTLPTLRSIDVPEDPAKVSQLPTHRSVQLKSRLLQVSN